jgi:hypothetical protein
MSGAVVYARSHCRHRGANAGFGHYHAYIRDLLGEGKFVPPKPAPKPASEAPIAGSDASAAAVKSPTRQDERAQQPDSTTDSGTKKRRREDGESSGSSPRSKETEKAAQEEEFEWDESLDQFGRWYDFDDSRCASIPTGDFCSLAYETSI